MADVVAPEFIRFVAAERRAGRLAAAPKLVGTGEVSSPVRVPAQQLTELIRVAAKRASGLFHATKHTEVVWIAGDSQLAVSLVELNVKLADGLIHLSIPVRCDQTGAGIVEVIFAVGSPNSPGGLYASTYRRPTGPPLIVSVWSEALVAFAWQSVLGLLTGIAGAVGKDAHGNVLVPVELMATSSALEIVPMARHRFAGSSGLTATKA
jgi:hypothetical protein